MVYECFESTPAITNKPVKEERVQLLANFPLQSEGLGQIDSKLSQISNQDKKFKAASNPNELLELGVVPLSQLLQINKQALETLKEVDLGLTSNNEQELLKLLNNINKLGGISLD
jgi:hypothetical protein